MNVWHITQGSDKTKFTIYLDEVSMFWQIVEDINMAICDLIPQVTLPTRKLKEEYMTLDQLWHCHICSPIFQFCFERQKSYQLRNGHKVVTIDISYEKAKEEFPEEVKWFEKIYED